MPVLSPNRFLKGVRSQVVIVPWKQRGLELGARPLSSLIGLHHYCIGVVCLRSIFSTFPTPRLNILLVIQSTFNFSCTIIMFSAYLSDFMYKRYT